MAKARGDRLVAKMDYRRNPMAIDARNLQTQAPAQPTSGFFGGLGNRLDQTVQGIGQMFGAQPPQRDPSQEWITDTRPRPSWDELMASLRSRTPRNGYVPRVPMPDPFDPGFDGGRGRRNPGYGPVPMPDPFDPGFDGGRRDAFELPRRIDGGEGTDAELFDRFRRQRPVRPREMFQYGAEASVQDMGGMFQVPPEPSARGGNPMFPADAAQQRPLNIYRGGLQAQTQPLVPFEQRDPARPLVNFMPPAQQQRSPSPMTYEPPLRYSRDVPQVNPWYDGPQTPLPSTVANQGPMPEQNIDEWYRNNRQNDPYEGETAFREKMDAMTDRIQTQNPRVPNSPLQPEDPYVAALEAESRRIDRQGEILENTPIATNSAEAAQNGQKLPGDMRNPMTVGPAQGYNGNIGYANDPNRSSAERSIASSQANAQRLAEGGAAADPTNGRGRFGGAYGAGLDADATALAEGRAVRTADGKVVYFTGTQESARQAQTAGKTEREALRNRDNPAATEEEALRRARADAAKAEREARHQAFKDATGGMNYRQYDRMTGSSNGNNSLTMKAVREGRLSPAEAEYRMQIRAEKALRRSGNPVAPGTSQAGTLYPDLMGRRGARAAQNPMGRTLEGQQQAATRIEERETSSPHIAGLGVEPGSGLVGLNTAFAARIAEDPNTEFSDDSLREYQSHAADYSSMSTEANSAFAFGSTQVAKVQAELWKELAKLPDSPKERLAWLKKYKAATVKSAAADAEKPAAPVAPEGQIPREPPIAGNPFGWAAPGSNSFRP